MTVDTLPQQVLATDTALALIESLVGEHGPLIFHQSGGCCDGSSPMCYPAGDLMLGGVDVLLGEVGGVPFYMSQNQFEYWKHTQLTLDVVPGRGGMFSVEGSRGVRFLIRSRIFTNQEIAALRVAERI